MTRITRGGNANPVSITEIENGVEVPITTTSPLDVNIQTPNPVPITDGGVPIEVVTPPTSPLAITWANQAALDAFARQG